MGRRIAVIGFDLGETLLTYADTPPNWAALYAPALTHAAAVCALEQSSERIAHGSAVLSRYNTRLTPRRIEIGAEQIFGEILATWSGAWWAHRRALAAT